MKTGIMIVANQSCREAARDMSISSFFTDMFANSSAREISQEPLNCFDSWGTSTPGQTWAESNSVSHASSFTDVSFVSINTETQY
jgi:hypothetical protein